MAWTTRKWYGLRDTLAYITDPADQGFVGHNLADAVLPVFPLSVTVGGDSANTGWVVGAGLDGARNRSAVADAAIAGTHFVANTSGGTDFVIDGIPSGFTYGIRIAAGDAFGFGTTKPHIKIYDNTTLRATIDGTAGITGFMDASGVDRADTVWRANNVRINIDLANTAGTGGTAKMVIRCGDTGVAGNTALNAVGIIQLSAIASGPTISGLNDSTLDDAQAGIVITGTNFSASGNAVKICPSDNVADAGGVTQTITAQGTTSITFTAVKGTLNASTPLFLFVTNGSSQSNASGFPVQFNGTGSGLLFFSSGSLSGLTGGLN